MALSKGALPLRVKGRRKTTLARSVGELPSLSVAARWTASLDRSCARRPLGVWVGAKKRLPGRTKKLKDEKMDRTLGAPP